MYSNGQTAIISNNNDMKEVDSPCYKYLGVLQMDRSLTERMESQLLEGYVKRLKKLC